MRSAGAILDNGRLSSRAARPRSKIRLRLELDCLLALLVRLITRDDSRQASSADHFIQQGAWVPVLALAEATLLLSAVYDRAAADIAITVTPALPFGSSDHHLIFGATLSLRTETYYRVLNDLLRSLVTDGFRRIFLLNGHGGNHELRAFPEVQMRSLQSHTSGAPAVIYRPPFGSAVW